jgi:hypothetical protein
VVPFTKEYISGICSLLSLPNLPTQNKRALHYYTITHYQGQAGPRAILCLNWVKISLGMAILHSRSFLAIVYFPIEFSILYSNTHCSNNNCSENKPSIVPLL